jgi:hypothetical protein
MYHVALMVVNAAEASICPPRSGPPMMSGPAAKQQQEEEGKGDRVLVLGLSFQASTR